MRARAQASIKKTSLIHISLSVACLVSHNNSLVIAGTKVSGVGVHGPRIAQLLSYSGFVVEKQN